MLELRLDQVRYEAERAHRQYNAVEPENRLVAAELEKRWNQALVLVREVETEWMRVQSLEQDRKEKPDRSALLRLAEDLPRV